MKIQNKLGTYLAVTAGVGCAASVAEGAIVVVDLRDFSISNRTSLPIPGSDLAVDVWYVNFPHSGGGFFSAYNGATFFSNAPKSPGFSFYAAGFYPSNQIAMFPDDPDDFLAWHTYGVTRGMIGENWVAFRDSAGRHGWLSFTLSSLGTNSTRPVSGFNFFVYDDTSTGPANAITLQQAVAAAVPEPSSLVLLALGATGLVARRQRKKAA